MNEADDDLKTLLDEVSKVENKETNEKVEEPEEPVIDILNLPPRTDVHKSNTKSIKLKFKSPIVRFITVLLIIAIIVFLEYYYLVDDIFIFLIILYLCFMLNIFVK